MVHKEYLVRDDNIVAVGPNTDQGTPLEQEGNCFSHSDPKATVKDTNKTEDN